MLNNGQPLYSQIEDELRFKIESGEWDVGGRIPTEKELGQTYGVSRITVRRALSSLVEAGYLERLRAKGTFVKSTNDNASKSSFTIVKSYTNEMLELGRKPVTMWAQVEKVPADESVRRHLHVEIGTPVLHLLRLRGADNEVITLADTVTPFRDGYSLKEETYMGSLYEYLSNFGIHVSDQSEYVEAIEADSKLMQLLRLSNPEPLLKRVRKISDKASGYVEYSVNYYVGSRYRYYVAF